MSSLFIVTIARMVSESYAVRVPEGMDANKLPHETILKLQKHDPIVTRHFGVFQNSAVAVDEDRIAQEIVAGDNETTWVGLTPQDVIIDLGSL